jgi:hypothetical protein
VTVTRAWPKGLWERQIELRVWVVLVNGYDDEMMISFLGRGLLFDVLFVTSWVAERT